MTIFNHKL